jgi:rubrerythrin
MRPVAELPRFSDQFETGATATSCWIIDPQGGVMSFNPLNERGIPLERQFRNWSELNVAPYDTRDVHPYTRCRVIAMNGIEVEAIINSHNFNRHTADTGIKQKLAMVRRVEQQQQKAVNWLIPAQETPLERTIGYEQVAVDLTAWLARHEPDPYLTKVYEFALLEDFDHLYRYANLMDMIGEKRKAEDITGGLSEIMPGRPTIFHHRDPHDTLNRPMTLTAADTQSVMNAITIVAAEQQTMNWYMNIGNIPEDPLARALYLEIAQVEEEHVTHYESILDPTLSWLTNLVLHEYNECWLYWSCMQTEVDNRIKALWELHLNMEIEHLRIATQMLRDVEGVEAESFLPAGGMPEPMTFETNKEYVRDVLDRTVMWTPYDAQFVPVTDLPPDHRFFEYQRTVNAGGSPGEEVISRHRAEFDDEYRSVTEGPHPVAGLREDGRHEGLGYHSAGGRTPNPQEV